MTSVSRGGAIISAIVLALYLALFGVAFARIGDLQHRVDVLEHPTTPPTGPSPTAEPTTDPPTSAPPSLIPTTAGPSSVAPGDPDPTPTATRRGN
jgi:hypothetical protein